MPEAPQPGSGVRVPFNYLPEQFAHPEPILQAIAGVVASGDFTLGAVVTAFESAFAAKAGARHAIGVNSGTDGLKLALRAAGTGPGDEVITAANTFVASVGAIAELGARPVFVDVDDSLCLDLSQVEAAIGPSTRAIMPVHLSGTMVDMAELNRIAGRHGIAVVEDACQAFMTQQDGRQAGTWGRAGVFSMHPLKFLNIWGDGGVIVTDDDGLDAQLRLLRNHGLVDRDTVVLMGCNSRLDSLQAAVALQMLPQADAIVARRNAIAARYDAALAGLPGLRIPRRHPQVRHSFVTYQLFCDRRDALAAQCAAQGIEVKIHYPVPIYRQPALAPYLPAGARFPETDRQAAQTLTLPVHQYLDDSQVEHVVATLRDFALDDSKAGGREAAQ
ncbi:MAG: DegT/DnrJ/EryC1/StrS family aminotransferase [Sneathiellaceae bacterium]